MTVTARIRRGLAIALAAIAAASSTPGAAGASEGRRCEAMPEGCAACCCEEGSSPAMAADPASAAVVSGLAEAVPRRASCECRAPRPSAPASAPNPGEDGRRVEIGRDVAASSFDIQPGRRRPEETAWVPGVGPPRSPLYLRTMRLLI